MLNRLFHSSCHCQWTTQITYSFLSTTVILHLLLMTCQATIFHIPLKRYQKAVSSTYYSDNRGIIHHVNKRQASSLKIDTDSMKDNVKGLSGDGYYVDVNIGSPPQKLQVLIDTGSANFAIACEPDGNIKAFFHRGNSSSYEKDGTEVHVSYTEGEWTGELGTDKVALTSAKLLSTEANIACITSARNFYQQGTDWQGILGLAYSDLAQPDSSITPFWDSLQASHPDMKDVFSIQLCGSSFVHTSEKPLMEGSLILGGTVPSLAKSEFFYTPLYKKWYYEVIITDIQVGDQSLNLDCKEYNMDKSIVDSGTTTVRLPVKIFKAITNTISRTFKEQYNVSPPNPQFFSGSQPLCFDDMGPPFHYFPIVRLFLMETGNTSFRLDLTPQHYLRPVATDSEGGEVTQSCVKFGFASSNTGTVLGAVLMEAFYVVFDRANSRIGFAQTSCPLPDPSNKILDTSIHGPFAAKTDLTKCAFQKPDGGEGKFMTTTYVLLGISLVICIPLVLLCVFRIRKSCQRQWNSHVDDDFSETRTVFSTGD